MKKRKMATIVVWMAAFFLVTGLLLGCGQQQEAAKPEAAKEEATAEKRIKLDVPVCFATVLPGLGTTITWLADRIETASGGTMKIQVYEPGKLVAPFEILDSVSTGKVNAGYSTAGYWAGKIPASPFFTAVPFGPEAGEYLAWLYYGNGMKLYQEMYDTHGYNVKVLVLGIIAPETSGWYKEPVTSIEEYNGLRIRFFGFGGDALAKLGASVSLLPGGEIFPALEKKAIDATEFSMPAIDERLGFSKIAKYNYYPGWHQQATVFELLINKDVWNSMSEQQKMVLEMSTRAATLDAFAMTEAIQAKVMKKNIDERGVTNMYWSDEMLAKFKAAWDEVATEQSAKDPFFKKVNDDLNAFREEYKLWQTYGFLPRPEPPS